MEKDDRFKRTHPYSMLRHIKIYAVLLVLTIVQQIFLRPDELAAFIGSLGLNAFYVLTVLFYFITEYTNKVCRMTDAGFEVKSGIFFKRQYIIPYRKMCSVMFYTNIISMLFNAESVSVDTAGGVRRKYDFSAYFSRKKANEVLYIPFKNNEHNTYVRILGKSCYGHHLYGAGYFKRKQDIRLRNCSDDNHGFDKPAVEGHCHVDIACCGSFGSDNTS